MTLVLVTAYPIGLNTHTLPSIIFWQHGDFFSKVCTCLPHSRVCGREVKSSEWFFIVTFKNSKFMLCGYSMKK